MSGVPTVDVLHAIRYIPDSDMRLIQQYHVVVAAAIAKPTDLVLTLQTKSGELGFDASGQMTLLRPPGK